MSSVDRGSRPKKTDDRSCGRRIRKPTRQAGSPGSVGALPVGVAGVLAEVARLSYQLRKRRVPKRAFSGLSRVRALLVSLVRGPPPFQAPSTQPGQLPSVSAGVSGSGPVREAPGLGYSKRPVRFVSGGLLEEPVVLPSRYRQPRSRPGGVFVTKGFPKGLSSDPRVAGTFLESATARRRRALREAGKVSVVVGPSHGVLRARRDPSPEAPIGTLALLTTMNTMKNSATDAFVDEVRRQAPPDLAALLADGEWGVMQF